MLKRKEDEISTFIISLTPSEFRARRKAKKELAAELELAFKKFRLEQIRSVSVVDRSVMGLGISHTPACSGPK